MSRRVSTTNGPIPDGYLDLLDDIKREITTARLRTALAVNAEMIELYWRIGRLILDRQRDKGWGAKVVQRLSVDLKTAYPHLRGFSPTNLRYMRAFAAAWPEIFQQAVGRIPWGHIVVLLDQVDDRTDRDFYAARVVEEGWSRNILINMIKARVHERVGAGPTTFAETVPLEQREAVQQMVRDPYIIDWIGDAPKHERDLEDRLVAHIANFLQELGTGFAFVGRQYCLLVDGDEFFCDLLFYNFRLRRFVVIELKIGKFLPEAAGKLTFYVNAIDQQLRDPVHDEPTIGILLVAQRNDAVVDLTLKTMCSPLAVSTYEYGALPAEVRAALPTEAQLAHTVADALADEEASDS
ncbi:PDDEXK nuclease domain-containing protein [Actinoallomurus purpureus]|uniref:PDDEXK nuclease domain-containing protein n=1 Tax=Actinoallomurus purpureus TaxID=478114 RepID=UPI002093B14E|nr:PDDEXK nuclease domain-containing protein [Actinoallomurus purpureus]MCO6007583.1 PDDEXK nuclease domain-containing protein [Actinoallomurus purpureus]